MKKISTRVCSLALALALCVGLCASAAAAGQEIAQYHSKPAPFGLTKDLKESWTSLYKSDDTSGWGATWARDQDGDVLPAGSLGVEARLYNKDGELVSSTGMRYNTESASFVSAATPAFSGVYCSYGLIRFSCYEDEDYFEVSSDNRVTADGSIGYSPELGRFKCPENLMAVIQEHKDGYPRNDLNETYGSNLIEGCGHEYDYGFPPVLVSAVGTGGVHGYVREADLNPYLDTRKDAVDYMSKLEENRVLPLYKEDGKTVIGTFVLDGSFTSGTTDKELESAKASAAAKPGEETRQKVTIPTDKASLDAMVKRSEVRCPYGRTSKGETYGTSSQFGSVGYEPVWIEVVSQDSGEDGLVYSKDFYYTDIDELPVMVPVYDLEGEVVGNFWLE